MARKRINRNPFNEKLLHRYLLAIFYGIHGSDRASINKLLPDRFHHSTINLVVPEAHLPKRGYRPDLTLFFRGHREGVPVEVKWLTKAIPTHQLAYLRSKNGILVSLDVPESTYAGVHCSQIDWNHFRDWFSRSSLRLLRDTFNPDGAGGTGWVVVLRGTAARKNFNRMLTHKNRDAFWAFKNNPTSIKSVLELSKDDQILFLFVSTQGMGEKNWHEGNKLMLKAQKRELNILDWYIGHVTEPYYMDLSAGTGNFFELGRPAINDRRWPHFVRFSIAARRGLESALAFTRGALASPLAISANHGGIPVRLNPGQWDEIVSWLRARLSDEH